MEYELWDTLSGNLLMYTEDTERIIQFLDKLFELNWGNSALDSLVLGVYYKFNDDEYDNGRHFAGSEPILDWLELVKSL